MSNHLHAAAAAEPGRPGSTYSDGPVWHAFGVSRAAYLVLPRRTLQSMPIDWQARFVALIREARQALPDEAFPQYQAVRLRDGKYTSDPNCRYRRTPPFPDRPAADACAACEAPLAGAFVNTFTLFDQASQ